MADTTIPDSTRGRAVETRLGLQAAAGAIAPAWKPVRFYSLTGGMPRPKVKDEKLGVPTQNTRESTKRKRGLPGGSLRRVVPINLTEAGYWLSAGFHRAAPTGADGEFEHGFTAGNKPSALLSLATKYDSGDFVNEIDVAVGEIQIAAQKTDQTARFTLTLIPLKAEKDDAWPGGAVAAAAADDNFNDWQWRVLWNDVLVGDATNLDLTITLGVERINGLSGDEWPTRHHFGEVDVTGSFRLYGRGKTFRDFADTDDVGVLILEAVDPDDATRFLRIEQSNVQFEEPQDETQGGGQMSADFTYSAAQDSDTPAVTIALGNGVAAY
jgi:hypothetical protein